jgi:hypothetical protein
MWLHPRFWLAYLALAWLSVPASAQTPTDPLRLVPAEADLLVKIDNPGQLLQNIYNLDAFKDLQKIEAVRELYDSTNTRRFNQLVAYFEKKLGADKYELLDKLAGGGAVLAVKIANPPPVLAVVQGKDEKLTQEFLTEALEITRQELERQERKEKIARQSYHDIEIISIGNDFHLARLGAALIAANKIETLRTSLDQERAKDQKNIARNKNLAKARRMLDGQPQIWAWVNLESVRKLPQSKEFFNSAAGQPIFNLSFIGPMIDLANRSPFVIAGLQHQGNRVRLTVRYPRGLEGMPDKVAAFFPKDKKGSTLPLLEPPNVVSSTSYFLDAGEIWKNRSKIFKDQDLKNVDMFEKNSGRFIGGVKFGDLLNTAGVHQRFVVTQPTESVYKTKTVANFQAYALVQEMRDPAFARHMDRLIRTGAILAATQFNLKLVEEKHGDVVLVTYRFPEDKKFPGDQFNIRFGFSPCYAHVGNQFIAASTVELGRDLIKVLQQEQQQQKAPADTAMLRSRFYASGLATTLREGREQVVSQFALSQALPVEQAQQQVDTLIELIQSLGNADLETHYGPNDFRLDIIANLKK